MRIILLTLTLAVAAIAQSGYNVVLTWTASPTAGVNGYNMYRAPGSCTAPGVSVKVNVTPLAGLTYTDSNVPLGVWCYTATALGGGLESGPSPRSEAKATPLPPGSLTISVVANITVTITQDGVTMAQASATAKPVVP